VRQEQFNPRICQVFKQNRLFLLTMKPFACISLATMTAIALLGSQTEYAFSQASDATLAKTETSS
jgi:nucleoside permease NupC